jgi:hypothetical protein
MRIGKTPIANRREIVFPPRKSDRISENIKIAGDHGP